MGQNHIGKSIERFLRSVEDLLGAQQCYAAPGNRVPLGPLERYKKEINALDANCHRLQSQKGPGRDYACAKTWTNAFFESKLALRIGLVLATVREQAEAATSGAGTTEVSRGDTRRLVIVAGRAAFMLLLNSSLSASTLCGFSGSSNADKRKGMEALTAMAQRGFMQAVADAVRAMSAFAASLRAEAGDPPQPASARATMRHGQMPQFVDSATASLDGLGGPIADAVCQHMVGVVLVGAQYTMAAEGRTADPQAFSVNPEGSSVLDSLAASGLVAAAAAAVVDCPRAAGLTHLSLSRAACNAARAMTVLAHMQKILALHGGPEGRRLACDLLRATRHVAVRRLQVALLDQLAAHAGMGAELGGGAEGQEEEQQEQGVSDATDQQGPPMRVRAQELEAGGQNRPGDKGQEQEQQVHVGQARAGCPGQEQADGWAGSSGAWWFAREEAQRGKLLGPKDGEERHVAGSPTAGWLEGRHCAMVSATLCAWSTAEEVPLEEEAGAPAAPPPVLRARLAARAAEALCRLCRGQGLEAAYAPAPRWELAMARGMVQCLLPTTAHADSLPAATARSCLPHWLEAAGWAAALMSDATAAAMGRLPSTPREGVPVHVMQGLAQEGSQAGTLDAMLALTDSLAEHEAYGVHTLSGAAYGDVRRRLFRCGMAASLDHTLRLAYSAQDGGQADVASSLYRATELIECIAYWGLAPLVPPTATADDMGSGDGEQGGEGGGGGPSAGGEGTGDGGGGDGRSSTGLAGNSDCGARLEATGGGGGSTSAGGGVAGAGGSVGKAGGGSGGPSGGGAAGAEAGDQLGVLPTLSKRAAMLTRVLEGEAGTGTAGVCGQGQGQRQDKERREELMGMASGVLGALGGVLRDVEGEVRRRLEEVHGKDPDTSRDGDAATCQAPGVVCVDEAHEALALGARAACNLAATFAWQLAAGVAGGTAAAAEPAVQPINDQVSAVLVVLGCLVRWCSPPMLLPPAQLLACQPHRLLAATCALPTEDDDMKRNIGQDIAVLVVSLSAHKVLSGRVRSWLAPPPSAAAAVSVSGIERSDCRSGHGNGDAFAGCLAVPLQCAIRPALGRPFTAEALALLKLAAGEVARPEGDTHWCPGGGDGSGGSAGEADGRFLQYAAAAYEKVQKYEDDQEVSEASEPLPPDGSHGATDLMGREQGAGGNQPQPPQPLVAPTWPLPPPLVLPPGRDLALPRLRVCGNPRCGNFGCEGEWALPLKQCGGCRAVRYCGADCQRAHWREGHKAECRALAAGVASR